MGNPHRPGPVPGIQTRGGEKARHQLARTASFNEDRAFDGIRKICLCRNKRLPAGPVHIRKRFPVHFPTFRSLALLHHHMQRRRGHCCLQAQRRDRWIGLQIDEFLIITLDAPLGVAIGLLPIIPLHERTHPPGIDHLQIHRPPVCRLQRSLGSSEGGSDFRTLLSRDRGLVKFTLAPRAQSKFPKGQPSENCDGRSHLENQPRMSKLPVRRGPRHYRLLGAPLPHFQLRGGGHPGFPQLKIGEASGAGGKDPGCHHIRKEGLMAPRTFQKGRRIGRRHDRGSVGQRSPKEMPMARAALTISPSGFTRFTWPTASSIGTESTW